MRCGACHRATRYFEERVCMGEGDACGFSAPHVHESCSSCGATRAWSHPSWESDADVVEFLAGAYADGLVWRGLRKSAAA